MEIRKKKNEFLFMFDMTKRRRKIQRIQLAIGVIIIHVIHQVI